MLKIVLALLAGVGLLLVLFGGREQIFGLEPSILARSTFYGVLLLVASGWLFSRLRHDTRRTVRDIAAWCAIIFVLVGVYAYRLTFQQIANRILAEAVPGTPVSSPGGDVMVIRDESGSFVLRGEINGKDVSFVLDTGASDVVLTAATAGALALGISDSSYTDVVSTANGRASAARVSLDTVSIGQIVEHGVAAMVAKPGALQENLLGMSFLERLGSYEVRDDRLVLHQR